MRDKSHCRKWIATAIAGFAATFAQAEPPSTSYIFPAGAQRGTSVKVRIGGHYLHDAPPLEMLGSGIEASKQLTKIDRIWFEGPLIKQPASQQKEDYPQDYSAEIKLAADAELGHRLWRTWTAQGATTALPFIVGDLPETIEQEADGQPIPTAVSLPITINGRVFPREDVDAWTFEAEAGQSVTCSVAAAKLGSPLEARIEVLDPKGRLIAEGERSVQSDPQLRFIVKEAGRYSVRIMDARYFGLQDYVYRLTITSGPWVDHLFPLGSRSGQEVEFQLAGQSVPASLKLHLADVAPEILRQRLRINGQVSNEVLLDVDKLAEVMEAEPLPPLSVSCVANGRIESPGAVDAWSVTATKGIPLKLEVRAARLGSPLDSVLIIKNAEGKEVAKANDLPDGSADSEIEFTPPADGNYTAEVSDQFASRGGPAFAYRLRIAPATVGYTLSIVGDVLAVDVGTEKKFPVNVQRSGGFNGPIKLNVSGLPNGATAAEVTVAANQSRGEIAIKLEKNVPVQIAKLKIIGTAEHGGATVERSALVQSPTGLPMPDHLLLACTLPTPFRHRGEYQLRYVARGGVLKKEFAIERNGFAGPIEVSLAEKQGRHLQGVTGPKVVVPPEASTFEYPVELPPWMELGRTSRTNIMLVGEVADAAGVKHKVSYSNTEQNEQLIAIVSPAPLRLSLERSVVSAAPNSEAKLEVRIHRDRALQGACKLELLVPPHIQGVTAEPIEVAADAAATTLTLKFGDKPGPFNIPLTIRGVAEHQGAPIVAEAAVEVVLKD